MIGADGPLTPGEKQTLEKALGSEFFRICRKVISELYAREAAALSNPKKGEGPSDIFVLRGRLQGIQACYNSIMSQASPVPETHQKNARRVSRAEESQSE